MASDQSLHASIDRGSPEGPVLVLLHGRGSDERDLLPLGRMLHADATTVSVRAPFPAAPWGYGPGFAWYRFLGETRPDAETFDAGQDALAEFMSSLPARLNRRHMTLVLGGFSQGGTSSLAYLARHPGSVAGVLIFSGFVADHPSVLLTDANLGATPIFWGHGTADDAIPFDVAEAGWQSLRQAHADLETHTYQGMGHTISNAELRDASAWLSRVLAAGKKDGA